MSKKLGTTPRLTITSSFSNLLKFIDRKYECNNKIEKYMTLVSIVFKAVSHFLCQKYFSSKVIVPMSLCLPCQVLCLLDTSVHGKQTVYCNFFCTANYTLYKSPLVSSHFIPLKPLTPAYLSVLICSVAVFLL